MNKNEIINVLNDFIKNTNKLADTKDVQAHSPKDNPYETMEEAFDSAINVSKEIRRQELQIILDMIKKM